MNILHFRTAAQNTSNVMHILFQLNSHLETANVINMYATLFFAVFGFVGNMSALVMLVYARNKLPRIVDSTYLIILTLTNTGFLLVHFYMSTYIRILHAFNLDYKSYFQVLTTSQTACKLLNYFRYSFRLLNSFLTVSFCMERLLAVYCPLRVRALDFNFSLVFKICVLISFIVPFYSLFLYEVVPTNSFYHDDLNISKVFNHKSLVPTLGAHVCLTPLKKIGILLKCLLATFSLIFFSYFLVSASTLAIIFKLKRANKFVFEYWSRSSGRKVDLNQREQISRTKFELNDNELNHLAAILPSMPQATRQKLKRVKVVTSKIHDTRLLSSISASFVLLNTPYFIGLFRLFIYLIRKQTSDRVLDIDYTEENLINRLKFHIFILIGEIFQLVNFSVTGLLLYFSGQVYRLHAANLLKHIFSCFK